MDEKESIERRKFLAKVGTGGIAALATAGGIGTLVIPEEEKTQPQSETNSQPNQPEYTLSPESSASAAHDGIGVGVYLGDDTALPRWEEWLGCKVDYYSIVVQRGDWSEYQIQNMPREVPLEESADGRQLVVTFPMFPPGETNLQSVALGEHTDKYRRFARDFVERGLTDVYFRFGAEMNGNWSYDTAVERPTLYILAWKEVVDALDSVEGSEFEYIWAPNIGDVHIPAPRAYPGDDYVDQVGLTFYDSGLQHYPYPEDCESDCVLRRRRNNWERLVEQDYGLNDWAEFARDHNKPLVFPEYGIAAENSHLVGGGDNPHFFRWFNEWMCENNDVVGWHAVWSWVSGKHYVGPDQLFRSEKYPPNADASAAFKELFGCSTGCLEY